MGFLENIVDFFNSMGAWDVVLYVLLSSIILDLFYWLVRSFVGTGGQPYIFQIFRDIVRATAEIWRKSSWSTFYSVIVVLVGLVVAFIVVALIWVVVAVVIAIMSPTCEFNQIFSFFQCGSVIALEWLKNILADVLGWQF